jgi:tRNA-modifying protein YgfZ
LKTTSTVISVGGADAADFLQGQLSNDILRLGSEPVIRAAWCNPKGRVITVMSVQKSGDDYELRVPSEIAEQLVQRMTLFRFRSKVDFKIASAVEPVDPGELIRTGVARIAAEQSEKFTPHMLNLDLLDAISLDKGCYTGQEIVARTHYKGATKRRTVRFESEVPVNVGNKVSVGDRDVGEVLNAADLDLLAVVPVDRIGDALSVGASKLTYIPLPYLDLTLTG